MQVEALISIGLPVFNAEKTLGMAIGSILGQTWKNWELLIVDDGSTDQSQRIARSFKDPRIRVIADGRKAGITRRLNQLVRLSHGLYFARMDADDVAFPQRLTRQMEFLDSNKDIDLLGTAILVFEGPGKIKGQLPVSTTHEELCRKPWSGIYLPHPTWLGKTEWFKRNPYPEFRCPPKLLGLLERGQDQGLLFRAYQQSRLACLPEVLLGYCENPRTWKKMFFTRCSILRSFAADCLQKNKWFLLTKIIAIQLGKIAGDSLNLIGGLKWARNQLLPVSPALGSQWKNLWDTTLPKERSIHDGA